MEFVPLIIIGVVIGVFIKARGYNNNKGLHALKYLSSNIPVIEENVTMKRMIINMSRYRINHTCGGTCNTDRINKKYNLSYNVVNDNTKSFMANYISTTVSGTTNTSLSAFSETYVYIDISCSEIDTIEDADQRNMYVVNWMAI